jgi:hypothetical protein
MSANQNTNQNNVAHFQQIVDLAMKENIDRRTIGCTDEIAHQLKMAPEFRTTYKIVKETIWSSQQHSDQEWALKKRKYENLSYVVDGQPLQF